MVPKILASIVLAVVLGGQSQDAPPGQEAEPARRPPTDYMRTFLLSNTRPLGLGREDKTYRRLVNQPRINWAFRAAARHILD
jgi:hypothetical protein